MYAKFTCHKCGYTLFVSDMGAESISTKKLEEVAEMSCPICGEDAHRNWYFGGIVTEFKEEAD